MTCLGLCYNVVSRMYFQVFEQPRAHVCFYLVVKVFLDFKVIMVHMCTLFPVVLSEDYANFVTSS